MTTTETRDNQPNERRITMTTIDPATIGGVLLTDGWHDVVGTSFATFDEPALEFAEETPSYTFVERHPEGALVTLSGPLSAVLAVKVRPS